MERVVRFGPGESLTGVLTEPAEPRALPAVLLLDAGILHRVGPNRMNVELARRFAATGHRALRFDFAGIGDSPARTDGLALGEGVQRDIAAALDLVGGQAVVMGLCSGADNALRAAYRDPRVVGAALLDPTVFRTPGWYARRAMQKVTSDPFGALKQLAGRVRKEVAPPEAAPQENRPEMFYTGFQTREEVETHLSAVLARGVSLLYVFSGGWADIFNYPGQLQDNHPSLDLSPVRLHHHPEADHTFSRRAHREVLFAELGSWLAACSATAAGALPRA